MARPDCPRCGSDLIVAAPSGAPSVLVMELRGENVPVAATGTVQWVCRSCGHRWDPAAQEEAWRPQAVGDPAELDHLEDEAEGELRAHPGPSPGTTLMRARHATGKTLGEAARGTGVWERYLQALESDAPPEEFPSHGYARLYLREYARYLQLDPEPLLRDLDARHPQSVEPVFEPPPESRGRLWKVLAVVVAVLAAAAVLFFVVRQPADQPTSAAPPLRLDDDPVVIDGSGDVQLPGGPTKEPPKGVRATLTLTQPSWVQAVSDGEVVAAETLEPGKAISYRAKRSLRLTLGNAGAVRLRVSGEKVRTGALGEVVSLDFRWRDGEVSTART